MDQQTQPSYSPPGVTAPRKFGAKGIFAAVLGNGFEFYDFAVYAAYAVMIGKTFFPSGNPFISLMASLATFGAGFLARPLGGIYIGAFGDRIGRKPAMMLTIGLMALGSGLIGILPGYGTIGIFAPILLVLGRLIQGFAAGGELGPATMFMLESAPANRRCFYGSWQMASQNISGIFVGLIGITISSLISPESLNGWGWRIPFLLGILIAPVGIYIRNKLDETAAHADPAKSTGSVAGDLLGRHWSAVLLGMGLISGGTITQYFFVNMTNYAITVLKMPATLSLSASFITGIAGGTAAVVGGLLADKFGLKVIGLVPRLVLMVLVLPMMSWLVASPTAPVLVVVLGTLMAMQAMSAAALIILMPYCFPPAIRATGLSVSYAFGVMLFGGTAPIISTWLVDASGNPLAGAYYVLAANVLVVVCTLLVRTNRINVGAGEGVPQSA